MLDEFIRNQLKQLEDYGEELCAQLGLVIEKEADDNARIARLLETEDVERELFSPRSIDKGVRKRIEELTKEKKELQNKEKELRELLAQNDANKKQYQDLLAEALAGRAETKDVKAEKAETQIKPEIEVKTEMQTRPEIEAKAEMEIRSETEKKGGFEKELRERAGKEDGIEIDQEPEADMATQKTIFRKDCDQQQVDGQIHRDQITAQISSQLKKKRKEELQAILDRVDACFALSHRDRIKCKNELKKLQRFVREMLEKDMLEEDIVEKNAIEKEM